MPSKDLIFMKKVVASPINITVNGTPLAAYLEDEFSLEVKAVHVNVVATLKRQVTVHPGTKTSGTGSGRGVGKPRGLKNGRVVFCNLCKPERGKHHPACLKLKEKP